jgi:hypothetical protein
MSRHYCPAPIPRAPSYQELLGAHHIGSRAHLCLAEPLNMRRSSWRRCVASYFESTKRGFIASSPRWKELAPELARDFPKPTPEEYERARQRELKDSHRGSRFPYNLNYALHTMALARWRGHPDTRAYVQRRRQEGKSDKEALRCLKRQLSNVVFRQLVSDMTSGAQLGRLTT